MLQRVVSSIAPPPDHFTSQLSQLNLPKPTIITQLPVELVVEILNLCECQDVVNVCKSSRRLYDVAVPVLYSRVDLSTHYDAICQVYDLQYYIPNPKPEDIAAIEKQAAAMEKQTSFMRTIAEVPKYGQYVRELQWTVLGTYDEHWDPSNLDANKASCSECKSNDEVLWDTFQKLVNVTSLDICWLREWREVHSAPRIFTKAKTVVLSGCMSQEFITCLSSVSG